MKFILLLFVTVFTISEASGQVSGYKGQRFILSGDIAEAALNGSFYGNLEFAALRNASIYLNMQYKDSEYDQRELEANSSVQDFYLGLGVRTYQKRDVNAPLGTFNYLHFGAGQADISSNYRENNYDYNVDAQNVLFLQGETGVGVQTIYFDRLSITYLAGLTYTTIRADSEDLEEAIDPMVGGYGGNMSLISYNFGSPQRESTNFPLNSSINFSFRLMVGVSF